MRRLTYRALRLGLLALPGLIFVASAPSAQEALDCLQCHEAPAISESVHADVDCASCHTNVTDRRHMRGVEPLGDEACGGCHRRTARTVERSVHGGNANCLDCHGQPHEIRSADDMASAMSPVNQITNCGRCHDEPESLIDNYVASVHGRGLLRAGLDASAACNDCHGAHDIESVDSESSPTAHANSPGMCGQCHGLLLETWTSESAHGMAWTEGNPEGPVCTDCHSSHEIIEPRSDRVHLESPETCGNCHEYHFETYSESFHGKAGELGFVEGANCADCHTPHRNLGVDDPRSSVHPDNLAATCGSCHENVTASVLSFNPHSDPTDPNQDIRVFVIWVFMTGLLIGVFAFFGLHDSLWLQRTIVGLIRGEFSETATESGQYVRRFSSMNIHIHLLIIVTFLLLALTGLPLKFHHTAWAQTLMGFLGGVESAGTIHRIAAIGTFGYALFHLGNLFVRFAIKREKGLFWGPNSMVPQPKDIGDVFRSLRYFLYLGDPPRHDRWNYIEKFDYLAVFWGVLIIGTSGLFLWAPMTITNFLPGWTINAAYVIHSDEALLATGFIFVFHFFHTHLRPESFPMDTVIFTGKMSLERFKEERPLEYQRLVDNGQLDDYLVAAPTAAELRRAHVWGSLFLFVGILLAIGILWALLAH